MIHDREQHPGLLVLKSMQGGATATKILTQRLRNTKRYKEFKTTVLYTHTNGEYSYEVVVRDSKTQQVVLSMRTPILSETYTGEIEASLLLLYNS